MSERYEIGALPGGKWQETGKNFATLGALPLLVFIHKMTGYRWLSPVRIFGVAFFLFAWNMVANFHLALPFIGVIGATHETKSLGYVAWAFLICGLWQRRERLNDLRRGLRWHTFSLGISYLEFLKLPVALIYRFVEPATAFIAGLVLRKLGFGAFGLWLCFSAACLFFVACHLHEKQLNHDLDSLDTSLEAEMQAKVMEHFERGEASAPRSLKETGGIPTGADAGIEAEIAKRKREAAAKREQGL